MGSDGPGTLFLPCSRQSGTAGGEAGLPVPEPTSYVTYVEVAA
jgi:hypothetical protein